VNRESETDRRDFLRAAGRWALAGLLSGGVGALSVGRRDRCTNAGLCRGCGAWETCELPEAVALRQAERHARGRSDAGEAGEVDTP